MKDKKENCENNYHKSFQLSGNLWKCQWCFLQFTEEEIKKIMVERRQDFEVESEE